MCFGTPWEEMLCIPRVAWSSEAPPSSYVCPLQRHTLAESALQSRPSRVGEEAN